MHTSRYAIIFLALLSSSLFAIADEPTVKDSLTREETGKVDEIFSKLNDLSRPGCSVSVVRDGNILYSRGFGLAQMEYDIPIKADTIFHIASVSKQFTVFAVALLAADEKLDLDDNVRDYIPETPDFGHRITLRHLIHHTSGLRDQWDLFVLAGGRMDDVIATSDVLELVSKQIELNFPPGEEHLYCNTGYTLLGVVVERVSGLPFRDFCDQRVFKPLGMTRTHFHDDHRQIVPARSYSYRRKGKNGYEKSVLSYANAGATSLFTTVEDLAKWQRNFEQPQVGNDQVFETMFTRGRLNDGTEIDYAGGLVHGKYRGLELVGHGGADAGFRSYLGCFPSHKLSIAVLGNYANCNPSQFALKVADVILDDEFPKSNRKQETHDTRAADKVTNATKDVAEVSAVTKAELDCCGWYFYPSEAAIYVVTARDNQLYMQSGFRKPTLMQRVAPLRFKSTISKYPFLMEFHPDAGTPRRRAEIKFPTFKLRSLEAVGEKGTEKDYQSTLPGRYYSEELEAFYEIVFEDEKLILKRRRNEDVPLQSRFRDGFSAGNKVIRLSRRDDGKITGFLLLTGRVRDLRFRRVEIGQ